LGDFYNFCTGGNRDNTLQYLHVMAWWRDKCITEDEHSTTFCETCKQPRWSNAPQKAVSRLAIS